MNRDDIIRLAREAGIVWDDHTVAGSRENLLERFANLVAAAEREACAQIVEREAMTYSNPVWAIEIVNDIRAKGEV